MASGGLQAGWKKTTLRLPRDLHKQVRDAAVFNDRTFNSQVVAFLRERLGARIGPDEGDVRGRKE